MNVLIVGNGGREHAIAWKIAQSPKTHQVFVAPGNAGTLYENKCKNVAIDSTDIQGLCNFAKTNSIDFTIIGPEAPLVAGIVDVFKDAGLRCFGPTKSAAQLEGSKIFSKEFLQRHNIPTASYSKFSHLDNAISYLEVANFPIVIKVDGLAGGKGVIICCSKQEAKEACVSILSNKTFGNAGETIIIEEFLRGEEASFIALVDGKNILPLASSQDHKALCNGDTGPNTGGMGAYSPAPVVTPEIHSQIMQDIMIPTVNGMAADGNPYHGFLYAGVMIDSQGKAKVLEFNCRLGDPETQPILMRLKTDLLDLCELAFDSKLENAIIEWDSRVSLGVVLASGGYPNQYENGKPITGLPTVDTPDSKVFHAGTQLQDDTVLTAGGRVLCVVALGDCVKNAQSRAYEIAQSIYWEDMYFRTDIGYRAITREGL